MTSKQTKTLTIVPAGTRLLTTLAALKSTINVTDATRDLYTNRAIAAASAQVEQFCNRVFAKDSMLDVFSIGNNRSLSVAPCQSELIASRRPITNIWAITDQSCQATTLASSMNNSQTTLPAGIALVGTMPFSVVVGTGSSSEVMTVNSLSAGTTYNVTRGANGNAISHLSGDALTVSLDASLYDFDPESAVISIFQRECGTVSVLYSAGYLLPDSASRTLPYDIEEATIRLASYLFFASDRDPAIRSDMVAGLGSIQYNVSAGNIPSDVAGILINYRTPVFS